MSAFRPGDTLVAVHPFAKFTVWFAPERDVPRSAEVVCRASRALVVAVVSDYVFVVAQGRAGWCDTAFVMLGT